MNLTATKENEPFIIKGVTAQEMENEGYFINVTNYAKQFGIQPIVRITQGVDSLLAKISDDHNYWDSYHDALDSLISLFREKVIELSDNKLKYFESCGDMITLKFHEHKISIAKDYTSGDAVHIFLPNEY